MSINNEEKLYFSIGEASKELDLEHHVLRFWEKQFKQIKPIKSNNRRLYSKDNLALIRKIKDLLYNRGFTIKGVQKYLSSDDKDPGSVMLDKQQLVLDSIKQLRYIQSRLEDSA
ncbi:MAG: MerR family transcriptional regulator [Rickettsiales bacterium]